MSTALLSPSFPRPHGDEAHPADVAARLDRLVAERSVPAEFLDTARARLDEVALRWREGTAWSELTWSGYTDRVARVASGLLDIGIRSGDRVALMLRNGPEFHIIDMAIMSIGATPVSIYLTSSPEQIDHIVTDIDATLVVVHDREVLERLRSTESARDDAIDIVIVDPSGVDEDLLTLREIESRDPIDLDALIEDLEPDDTATIIYTSGTTGPSKGVVLSHRNVLWAVRSLEIALGEHDLAGKRIISYLPTAHIAERSTTHYAGVTSGYEVTTCADPSELAEHLKEVRPHILFGVPRVWEKLRAGVEAVLSTDAERRTKFDEAIAAAIPIRAAIAAGTATPDDVATIEFLDVVAFAPVRDALGLDQIEVAVTGAAPIEPATIEWFRAVGVPLSEIYGMSESSGPIAWTPGGVGAGTIGPVIPGGELRLAEDGEILYRGGNVFVEYRGRPDATADAVDAEGWLQTGDIGELDADSNLRIVDRKKELIITAGGKNVSPANLESAIRSLPLVEQAYVSGDARPYLVALVTIDRDALDGWAAANGLADLSESELLEHQELVREVEVGVEGAMERFSRAERVKRVAILADRWQPDSDVLTPTLKLRRRALKERYAERIDSLYR